MNTTQKQLDDNSIYQFINELVIFNHLNDNIYINKLMINNFKTKKSESKTNFSFQLVDINYPTKILYHVEGNLLTSNNKHNYLFKITKPTEIIPVTYIVQTTKIDEHITLTEISLLNFKKYITIPLEFYLTIKNYESTSEKIIIPPDSDLYRMYKKQQIDLLTLSNLALTQTISYPKYDGTNYKTKYLDKKYT